MFDNINPDKHKKVWKYILYFLLIAWTIYTAVSIHSETYNQKSLIGASAFLLVVGMVIGLLCIVFTITNKYLEKLFEDAEVGPWASLIAIIIAALFGAFAFHYIGFV